MSQSRHSEFQHDIVTYYAEVARGNVPGSALLNGFGSVDVGIVTRRDVWAGPTAQQPIPPSTGVQMQVVSNDPQDTNTTGTGIHQLQIHYLDANGDPQTEIVDMAGTTPVNTSATDIRFVQCAHAWEAGSTNAAVGDISIQSVGGATTYKFIGAGETRCLSSLRMVPRGKVLLLHNVSASSVSGASKTATFRLESNSIDAEVVNGGDIFFPHCSLSLQDVAHGEDHIVPSPFPEFSIIKCTVTTSGAATVSTDWFGVLEDK